MRLTEERIAAIRRLAIELAGDQVRVRVFGSRLARIFHMRVGGTAGKAL